MAVQHHPDKNPGDPHGGRKIQRMPPRLMPCFPTLKNVLLMTVSAMPPPVPVRASIRVFRISKISSICSDSAMCSAGAAGGVRPSSEGPISVTIWRSRLEEAASGKDEKLRIPRLEKCDECDGSGAEKGTKAETLHYLRRQRPDTISAGLFQRNADVSELSGQGPDHHARPVKRAAVRAASKRKRPLR